MTFCGASGARPYNRGRVKAETERLLMGECAELASPAATAAVARCMQDTFVALAPAIRAAAAGDGGVARNPGEGMRVAVGGVDLMLACGSNADKDGKHESATTDGIRNSTSKSGGGLEGDGTEPNDRSPHGDEESTSFRAFVLEVNYCPAMPKKGKRWTDAYRSHLLAFLRAVVELGMCLGSIAEADAGNGAAGSGDARRTEREQNERRFAALANVWEEIPAPASS